MPPERLLVRYQLPVVLSGRTPALGIRAAGTDDKPSPIRIPLGATLGQASATTLIARLDPAPGLDVPAIARAASGGRDAVVSRVMMTPQYQLA